MTLLFEQTNSAPLPLTFSGVLGEESIETVGFADLERHYLRHIEKVIKSRWLPPKTDSVLHAQLVFRVTRDGHITALHLSKSSGSTQMDLSAILAVEKSKILPPIPRGLHERYDLQMTFQTNMSRAENEQQVQHKMLTPPKKIPVDYVPTLALPEMISPPPRKRA